VLKEPNGTLSPRIQKTMFTANNIFIMTSKSGKLTYNHFETWIKEVFFPNVGPNLVLLLTRRLKSSGTSTQIPLIKNPYHSQLVTNLHMIHVKF